MSFIIRGVPAEQFIPLYSLTDSELTKRRARRVVVNGPGYPERIEMRDAQPGEVLLLVNFEHQPADTPYRASHAIFIREGATKTHSSTDTIPDVMANRVLSLRAFDREHMLVDARLREGRDSVDVIEEFFANDEIAYIHAHYAKHGCFAAYVTRE